LLRWIADAKSTGSSSPGSRRTFGVRQLRRGTYDHDTTEDHPHAVYDGFVGCETGFATAHINNGAWPREPASYRVVTVGETGSR